MEIAHAADDTGENRLETIAAATAEAGKLLRLRVALQIWDGRNYQTWPQEVWKVEVAGAAEAREFQAALAVFFATMYRCGTGRTVAALVGEQEQPE